MWRGAASLECSKVTAACSERQAQAHHSPLGIVLLYLRPPCRVLTLCLADISRHQAGLLTESRRAADKLLVPALQAFLSLSLTLERLLCPALGRLNGLVLGMLPVRPVQRQLRKVIIRRDGVE